MIDQLQPAPLPTARPVPRTPAPRPPHKPAHQRPRPLAPALLLAAVFLCAACALVYELELVDVASGLGGGDSVTGCSVVLSVMVFAMGAGSLLAKRLASTPACGFAFVELALALTGGLSVMALSACFAWLGSARAATVAVAALTGVLVGAELPLLMTLIQRVRRRARRRAQPAGDAVADLFAADYTGALVGGLAFPFLLLPALGELGGALLTGAVNALAGGAVVLGLFRGDLTRRQRTRLLAATGLVLAVLGAAALADGRFERAERRAVYGADVRLDRRTGSHEVALARHPDRLWLDGRLRAGGTAGGAAGGAAGEAYARGPGGSYARGLAGPALAAGPRRARVLVLGGADGLAAHAALATPGVRSVTVVDPDAALLALARADPALTALNGRAFADGRVRVAGADPFGWLRRRAARADRSGYDVVLADLPGPADAARLRTEEFFGLARRALAPGGRLAVPADAVPADVAPAGSSALWTVDATLRAVGLRTVAYRADGGRWAYVLAAPGPRTPRLPRTARELRTPEGLDRVPPATLLRPR
jgi:spermidine synthase